MNDDPRKRLRQLLLGFFVPGLKVKTIDIYDPEAYTIYREANAHILCLLGGTFS